MLRAEGHSWFLGHKILALLAALFLLAACGESDAPPSSTDETEFVEQEAEERTFNDWKFEDVGFDVPVSIGNAAGIEIFSNQLFVWDVAPMSVKRYTLNGELQATYGNGKGQGPGQFQNLYSFAALGTDEVWIVDTRAGDISRFDYGGRLIETFQTEAKPARIAVVGDNRLVLQRYFEPKLFALMNEEGRVFKRFGNVVNVSQKQYSLMLDGELYPNPESGFIWAPRFASYLYFFNPDGTLDRRIELIDGHPFPIDKMKPNPMKRGPERWPQVTQAVSLTEDEIIVSVASTEPLTENGRGTVMVLDRYDRSSGKYLASKRIRSVAGYHYHVRGDMVYGVASVDTTLHKLRIHRSP